MLAIKLGSAKRSSTRKIDLTALAHEEAVLEQEEAQIAARLVQAERQADAALQALEAHRAQLLELTKSRAGGMAVEAMGKLPKLQLELAAAPEREKATEARLEAVQARRAALEAEHALVERRDKLVAAAEAAVAQAAQLIPAIRAKAEELAATAAAANSAVVPSPARAQAPRVAAPKPAPRTDYTQKRKCERVAVQTEVDLHTDSNLYQGFSSDLSDGGIFVATCNLLDAGTEVDLSFSVGGKRVEAKGVVRWHREYNDATPDVFPGMGIEFLEMQQESKQALHAFTHQREPMFWA